MFPTEQQIPNYKPELKICKKSFKKWPNISSLYPWKSTEKNVRLMNETRNRGARTRLEINE